MSRRSRSSSRSGSGGSRSRSRSSGSEVDGVRVHVGELPVNCSEKELEHIFKKFGPLVEVWMARVPPCFAFIVFRDKEDAEEAIRAMNGRTICGRRVRVSIARPRMEARAPRRAVNPMNDARCYQCGERGHLSRNCNASRGRRNSSPRRQRRRSSSYEKSRSRSRSHTKRSKRSRSGDRWQEDEPSRERTGDRSAEKERRSSRHSTGKRRRDQDGDRDGDDTRKERRRSDSTKAQDRESGVAGTSSGLAAAAASDNDSG